MVRRVIELTYGVLMRSFVSLNCALLVKSALRGDYRVGPVSEEP